VKKILRGYQREETDRLIAFRSHWGFKREFCNPSRGSEKGGVEGEVGYFRRNHLVPVPKAKDLGELNELVEASQHHGMRRLLARWMRYDVIALDEVGYVPLAEIGAELLFQVIAERAERATLIVTTNLLFSEWTQVFPNPRLCKALLDRVTDRAYIIETGTES
jgi:hypothetical protein